MTEFYAPVVIGTAATFLAAILLLLRAKVRGRRTITALARRWVATGTRGSTLILALLSAIAAASFANIPAIEGGTSSASAPSGSAGAPPAQSSALSSHASPTVAQELDSLRAYADKIGGRQPSTAALAPAPDPVALPDVDAMIAKLVARLDQQPDDVKGWKMLGWSYLNTDRPIDATKAYEAALALEPGDKDIEKGLEAARTAQTGTAGPPASGPPSSPTD